MTELARERCVACHADSPRVTEDEMPGLLAQAPEWVVSEDGGVPRLRRIFRFDNFKQALEFTIAVGNIAEEQNHHPRIVTVWGRVVVEWWTHKIRGLHRNDFIMAAHTSEVYGDRP